MHSFEGSHSTVPPKKQFYSKEISRGLVTEASAIRAEHEQMLLSLENQHKAALLLAQKAKLDLEANVHAKTAANKALAEALEISKADATNAAQTKESIRTTALGSTARVYTCSTPRSTCASLRPGPGCQAGRLCGVVL